VAWEFPAAERLAAVAQAVVTEAEPAGPEAAATAAVAMAADRVVPVRAVEETETGSSCRNALLWLLVHAAKLPTSEDPLP
jgi:hypothetical protein